MTTKLPKKPEPITERGMCLSCEKNPQRHKGKGIYGKECDLCHRKRYKQVIGQQARNRNKFRESVEDKCVRCGFVPEHMCQLDVDHIDGDHSNNDKDNLQTLCANCHRLKTFTNKDGPYKLSKED